MKQFPSSQSPRFCTPLVALALAWAACVESGPSSDNGGSPTSGGSSGGQVTAKGGTPSAGSGGSNTQTNQTTGGATSQGGTGGTWTTSVASSGGSSGGANGGNRLGGSAGAGSATGGIRSGGAAANGGNRTGGASSTGGIRTGGTSSAGGSSGPTVPPISGGCQGWASRYWDCCKPHCGWKNNAKGASSPIQSCDAKNASLGGNYDAESACSGGNAHMCHALVPWAISDTLSYGWAATSRTGDICGRCYQLQFTGQSKNAGADPGSQSLSGKTLIVQALNIGGDVASGQFDVLLPGGGVGKFNACSSQWGTKELGAQYGGFLTTCKGSGGDHAAVKKCVAEKCDSVFTAKGWTQLAAGCHWFVDWYGAADNPALVYKEVACPDAIKSKSGMSRGSVENNCN